MSCDVLKFYYFQEMWRMILAIYDNRLTSGSEL